MSKEMFGTSARKWKIDNQAAWTLDFRLVSKEYAAPMLGPPGGIQQKLSVFGKLSP